MNFLNLLNPLGLVSMAASNLFGHIKREATDKENLSIVKAKQELDKTNAEANRKYNLEIEKIRAGVQIGISDRQIVHQQELEQKRAKTQLKLALINAKNQQELQRQSHEFQAWLKEKEWAENRALTEYVQKVQLQIAADNIKFQQWKVAEEKALALELKRLDGEITLARGTMERETHLILLNQRYEGDRNPLWLTRRQFLADAEIESLRIFLSPISPESLGKFPSLKNDVNTQLTRIAEYYSSQGRAVKFFGDAWTNVKDAQEATAQSIFSDYKSQPILILDAQMEGEFFYLQYRFWGSNWQSFRSGVLVNKLSLLQQQYLYAKREVEKWQKLRNASQNPDDIDMLYGQKNVERLIKNKQIMEAEARASELGLDTDHFQYLLSEKEVKLSVDYLVLLHVINAGLWADIYFLLYAPTPQPLPPLLLTCLQDLELINPKDYTKEEIADLVGGLVKSYREVYQVLAIRGQGVLITDLDLQLSETCLKLKLYNLAKSLVTLSVGSWLTHRGVTPTGDLAARLQLMKPLITAGDRPYIFALQQSLAKLGVTSYLDDILPMLNLLEEQEKRQREVEEKHQKEVEEKHQLKAEEKCLAKQSQLKVDLGNGVILELVEIPAGSFMMGREVEMNIESFLLGKYPVTQEQWEAVMGNNPSYFINLEGSSKRPVECVSWDMVQEFCQKLSETTGQNFRLPSEAEWEYACRAGTKTNYFFGENDKVLKNYAWYNENSDGETHPVGEKKPNSWGLYDMLGNVSEWCEDDWVDNLKTHPTDGKPLKNNRDKKCSRGGMYTCSSINVNIFGNYRFQPSYNKSNQYIGFRVVVGLPHP